MRSSQHCDETLLNLNSTENYGIVDGFGTHEDWKSVENRVKNVLHFQSSIVVEGDRVFNRLDLKGLKPVSVHFRLADYLVLASLNLPFEYYIVTLKEYDNKKTIFLVFYNEIEKVKGFGLFDNKNAIFMDKNNSPAVDMYLMAKCS